MVSRKHLTRNTKSANRAHIALSSKANALYNEYMSIQRNRESLEKEISTLKTKLEREKARERDAYGKYKVAWARYKTASKEQFERHVKVYNMVNGRR